MFQDMIDEATWIDDAETKSAAQEKLKVMDQMLGYPDELLDEDLVSGIYENVTIDLAASFLSNALSVLRNDAANKFSK